MQADSFICLEMRKKKEKKKKKLPPIQNRSASGPLIFTRPRVICTHTQRARTHS